VLGKGVVFVENGTFCPENKVSERQDFFERLSHKNSKSFSKNAEVSNKTGRPTLDFIRHIRENLRFSRTLFL